MSSIVFFVSQELESARAQFEAGDLMAGIDAVYLCRTIGHPSPPDWIPAKFLNFDGDLATLPNIAKEGRHAHPDQKSRDMLRHLYRFRAVRRAMGEGHTGEGRWTRAAELLTRGGMHSSLDSIISSHKRVLAALNGDKQGTLWRSYRTPEVRELIHKRSP